MDALGAPGAGIATGLENPAPVVPSEIVLLLGGFTSRYDGPNYFALVFWTTLGSVLGAVAHYYFGRLLGRRRSRAIFGRIPLVEERDLDRAEEWFAR